MQHREGYDQRDPKGWDDIPDLDPDDLPDIDEPFDIPVCPKCGDTGYVRDWRGTRIKCADCWNDI